MSSSDSDGDAKITEKQDFAQERPQAKDVRWDKISIGQLCAGVSKQLDTTTSRMPFDQVDIDWSQVHIADASEEKCKRKWAQLLSQVRHYRTMSEVLNDVMLLHRTENSLVSEWNKMSAGSKSSVAAKRPLRKARKTLDANYPQKPKSSGYSLFSTECMKTKKHTMKEIGELWAALPAEEKQKYTKKCQEEKEEYLEKLQEYANDHPEDIVVKELLEEERKKSMRPKSSTRKRSRSKGNAAGSTARNQQPPAVNDKNQSRLDDFDDFQPSSKKLKKSETKHKELEGPAEQQEVRSPSKKRKQEDVTDEPNTSASPKKKKKSKHTKMTAEEMFFQSKVEEYKVLHPDLEVEELRAKLQKKFFKLKEKKQEKYRAMAMEYNDS